MKNNFTAVTHPIDRFNLLKAMDFIIFSLDDETPYYQEWISVVPDCAEDDDFQFIANDNELYDLACRTFEKIIKEI